MKPRAALALSIAGILVTGSAALAVNTYTLNGSHTSTLGNAGNVLLPDASVTTTPAQGRIPTNTVAIPKTSPKVTITASSGKKADDSKASPFKKPSSALAPGNKQAAPVTIQPDPGSGGAIATQPGAASGDGLIATQPGDDKGGLRGGGGGGSGGHGSDD